MKQNKETLKIIKFIIYVIILVIPLNSGAQDIFTIGQKNIVVYKRRNNDSDFLIQKVIRHDNFITIESFKTTVKIDSSQIINFIKVKYSNGFYANIRDFFKDTLIYHSDSNFWANNAIYSKINTCLYVKFNAENTEPYGIQDDYGLFISNISKDKNLIKFWNNSDCHTIDANIYIFKKNYWFLYLSEQDNLLGGYYLYSINNHLPQYHLSDLEELF